MNMMETVLLGRERYIGRVFTLIGLGVFCLGYLQLLLSHVALRYFPKDVLQYLPQADGTGTNLILVAIACLAMLKKKRLLLYAALIILLLLSLLDLILAFVNIPPEHYLFFLRMLSGGTQLKVVRADVAMTFILVSVMLWFMHFEKLSTQIIRLLGFLACLIILLGFNSYFVYQGTAIVKNTHLQFMHGSLLTAFALIALGISGLMVAGHAAFIHQNSSLKFLPILIIIIGILITLLLWQAVIERYNRYLRNKIYNQAHVINNEINARLHARINSLARMAHRWDVHQNLAYKLWAKDVALHIQHNPSYRALEWVDKHYQIRWVAPMKANEKVLGKIANEQIARITILKQSQIFRQPKMTGIINLAQGGQGFLIYVPLYVNNTFDGYLVAVVDAKHFLASILQHKIEQGFAVGIYQAEHLLYQQGESDKILQKRWAVKTNLPLYGTVWHFVVWPTKLLFANDRNSLPTSLLAIGLLMSFLLGLAIYLSQLSRRREREMSVMNDNLRAEIRRREQAEKAKQRLEKELLQSQKMQAIGTLAGGIAHDFNNMLYSMMGYLQLALDDIDPKGVTHRNLSKALEVGQRGKALVAQILAFSRQHDDGFAAISLHDLLDETLNMLQPTCLQEIQVNKHFCQHERYIYANTTQLQQVLINLIKNAADAMDGEGTLDIRTQLLITDKTVHQRFNNVRHAANMLLEIKDHGCGIDQADLNRIFEPFFTTKDVNKGTGLGLSIVHGIIQSHNGIIAVDSALNHGTQFNILLPLADNKGSDTHGEIA